MAEIDINEPEVDDRKREAGGQYKKRKIEDISPGPSLANNKPPPHYNGQTFSLVEQIDFQALKVLYHSIPDLAAPIEHNYRINHPEATEDDIKQLLEKQQAILAEIANRCENGLLEVHYAQQPHKTGRLFTRGGIGLQNLSKPLRHTLSAKNYYDGDVENAHPVFLAHYCRSYGIPHEPLEFYINNRTELFDALVKDGFTREQAKVAILAIMNGGQSTYGNKYFEDLRDWVKQLHTRIIELEPDVCTMVREKDESPNPSNLGGKVMNMILCDMENQVLWHLWNYLHAHDVAVDVLCFDGLMIRKQLVDGNKLTEAALKKLLNKACAYIAEQPIRGMPHLEIKLALKPMDKGLNISEARKNLTYESIKKEFERDHFKCYRTATVVTIRENGILWHHSHDEAKKALSHMKYIGFSKKTLKKFKFINRWLDDENVRWYHEIAMLPEGAPPVSGRVYNTWTGWEALKTTIPPHLVESANRAKQTWLDHISFLHNHDEADTKWFHNWLGAIIQRPGDKQFSAVAKLFQSEQGVGKNIMLAVLTKMLGDKYVGVTANPEEDVFGKFNIFLLNKVIVAVDELSASVGFKYHNRFKDIITRPVDRLADKCVKAFDVPSYTRFMFFTNNAFPVKVEESDRRLSLTSCVQKKQAPEYYEKLAALAEFPEGLRAILDFYLSLDLTEWNADRNRPETAYAKELKQASTPLEEQHLFEEIHHPDYYPVDGVYVPNGVEVLGNGIAVPVRTVFDKFQKWLKENGYTDYKTNITKYGMILSRMLEKNLPAFKGVYSTTLRGKRHLRIFTEEVRKADLERERGDVVMA